MDKKRIDGERNAIGANEDAGERLQPRRLLLGFLAVLGVWTFLGVFLGFQQYLNGLDGEKPIALAQAVKHSLSRYLIYVLLTPFVYWVCRRFSFAPTPGFELVLWPNITLRPRDGVPLIVKTA